MTQPRVITITETPLEELVDDYTATRKALTTALQKKRAADKAVIAIECQIAAFEEAYLEETASHGGSLIKGYDSFGKIPSTSHKRKVEVADADRIFSQSSTTFQRVR